MARNTGYQTETELFQESINGNELKITVRGEYCAEDDEWHDLQFLLDTGLVDIDFELLGGLETVLAETFPHLTVAKFITIACEALFEQANADFENYQAELDEYIRL